MILGHNPVIIGTETLLAIAMLTHASITALGMLFVEFSHAVYFVD